MLDAGLESEFAESEVRSVEFGPAARHYQQPDTGRRLCGRSWLERNSHGRSQ